MLKKVWLNGLLRAGLVAVSFGLSMAVATADVLPARDPYRINPGDVLQITVWKEQDLQRELLVNPDGHFAFPLAGDMVAEGKTVDQVRGELTEKLGRFIPDVVVTVAALQLNGNKIYVLGQVNRPGEFIMTRTVDVMQAIGMAGGPTAFAAVDDIKILRRGDQGSQIAIPFRYKAVEEGSKLDQNILLRAGDTVVVP
jgi:polysaccharide export outer membrane protein